MTDPTTDALRRFRERVEHVMERVALHLDDETDWAEVVAREAAILVRAGGVRYLRYVDELDRLTAESHQIAEQADVDHRFRAIVGDLS